MMPIETAMELLCHPRFAINSRNGCFAKPGGADAGGGGVYYDAYRKFKERLRRLQELQQGVEQEEQELEPEDQEQQAERLNGSGIHPGGEGLVLAAQTGHVEAVQLFLEQYDVPVDYEDGEALVAAAGAGEVDVVSLLLQQHEGRSGEERWRLGAEEEMGMRWRAAGPVLRADCQDGRALLVAVRGGHKGVVDLLLARESDAPRAGCWNGQALVEAVCGGHPALALKLLRIDNRSGSWPEPELGADLWRSWAVRAAVHAGREQVQQFLRDLHGLMEAGPGSRHPSPAYTAAMTGGYAAMQMSWGADAGAAPGTN